jgi:hypothetical protein
MRHSAEFLQKISSPTLLYATQREIQTKFSGRLRAMQHSAESRLRAMPHSDGADTYSQISLRNLNQIRKYFWMIISDLWRKSHGTVPLIRTRLTHKSNSKTYKLSMFNISNPLKQTE